MRKHYLPEFVVISHTGRTLAIVKSTCQVENDTDHHFDDHTNVQTSHSQEYQIDTHMKILLDKLD
jgi:hypothetical protein